MNLDDDFDAWDYIDHLVEDDVANAFCNIFPLKYNHSHEDNDFMQTNFLSCELSCVLEIEELQVATTTEDPPVSDLKELPKHLFMLFLIIKKNILLSYLLVHQKNKRN